MIIKYLPREDIFKKCISNTLFIVRFDLLYQYVNLSLKKFIIKWPGIKVFLSMNKFTENSFEIINSKYGKLFVLSSKILESGNEEQQSKEFINFKNWINNIDLIEDEELVIYRIDLYSFTWMMNKKETFKFIDIINNSKKKFQIYY
jgi:hypothetical protein